MNTTTTDKDRLVTVCDKCLRACCWRGIEFCEGYRNAGTKQVAVRYLEFLAREHSDWHAESDDYPEPCPSNH